MTSEPFVRAWTSLHTPYKVAAVAVLIVLVALISTITGGAVAHFKDRRFDAAEAARVTEREKKEAESRAWRETAVKAEARAVEAESALTAKKQADVEAAVAVTASDDNARRIADETQAAIDAVDAQSLTPDERLALIRKMLADLERNR